MKHIWKIKGLLCQKGEIYGDIAKGDVFKDHRKCSLRTSTKGRLFRTFNSYSLNFNGRLCMRRTGFCPCWAPCPKGEQFLWFVEKRPCAISLHFTPFWLKQTFVFWDVLGKENKANLCPIMSHFDWNLLILLCRPEEVISFFWCSVYDCHIIWSLLFSQCDFIGVFTSQNVYDHTFCNITHRIVSPRQTMN